MKKIFKLDFIIFALLTLFIWIMTNLLIMPDYFTSYKVTGHNDIDHHTRQALAWQKGQLYLDEMYRNLELAEYQGKVYVTFPATPTLVEFPFALIFGNKTPNNLIQMICVWLSMLMWFFILEKFSRNRWLSFLMSFSFFWGTNILYLSLSAPVWHQGHMYGIFFASIAFTVLFFCKHDYALAFGALALGLCVGCRPFYFFYIPFYLYLAAKRFPFKKALLWVFIGLIPPGLFVGGLNVIRFGSPTTFGHIYLDYSRMVDYDVFGFEYLPRNLRHTFIQLPEWNSQYHLFNFNGRGNSILLISPVMFLGFWAFFKRKVHVYDKVMAGATVAFVWFLLLLHCGNGWFQFGYRYATDLIPVFLVLFAWSYKKLKPWMIAICVYSIVVNFYGALWFYNLQYKMWG